MFDRTLELVRLMILVAGIVLLVVFGTRAASQASNIKLVGGKHKLFIASVTANSLVHLQPTGSFAAVTPLPALAQTAADTTTGPPEAQVTVAHQPKPTKATPAPANTMTSASRPTLAGLSRPTLPAQASPVAQARIQATPVATGARGLPIKH